MFNAKKHHHTAKKGVITPHHDKKGISVKICDVTWFNPTNKLAIGNSLPRTASLLFDGNDLNYLARVLNAEASGSVQLTDADQRKREKAAILNVIAFRLNRKGYPTNTYIAKTFTEVCNVHNQFESTSKGKVKNQTNQYIIILMSTIAVICRSLLMQLRYL